MFTYLFFHPDHIIPVVEFVTAFMELTYKTISHMSVKFHTVFVKMFIFLWRIGNAGIHIENSLSLQSVFQSVIQKTADPRMSLSLVYIDGRLNSPVVSSTFMEWTGIGITENFILLFSDKVRIFLESASNPSGK